LEADGVEGELGRGAQVRVLAIGEGIVERLANSLFDDGLTIQRNGVAEVKREEPQIVEAKNVVGVLVREEDGVDEADALAEKLLPQVGGSVDEEVAAWQADERRAAGAFIARIVAGADIAGATDRGDTDTGSRAEQNELAADVSGENVARQRGTALIRGTFWIRNLLL
jgi:hypothetical protein